MFRNALALSRVALCNLFGLNEARYARDKKKKRRAIFIVATYALVTLMMMFYAALTSAGLCAIGMARVAPAAICAGASLITLAFTLFWAGGALFDLGAYEREIALPVKTSDIVLSRFFVMYAPNAVMSLLGVGSGFGVYAYFAGPDASSYIMALTGALIIPLIPMSAACALGAAIYGAASVMRRKNLVNIVLALAATMALMALPAFLPDETDTSALYEMSRAVEEAISRVYVPAKWFASSVTRGGWAGFALFALVSVALFAATLSILQWKYADICRALSAHRAGGHFSLSAQKRSGLIAALYKKELGRYFASPVYVLNTVIGYVMMLAGAIALAVMGIGKMAEFIPSGIIGKFLPFAVAALSSMSTTTCSAISIEGKQWWIMKTLPVSTGAVFDAKTLVQLTVALPFYAASCMILSFVLRLEMIDLLCLWVTPLCYILFTAVLGITMNAAMPVFDWDSETAVVKQSASMGLSMLAGLISVAVPAAIAFIFAEIDARSVCLAAGAAVLIAGALLRRRNNALNLSGIGD